MKRLHAEAIVPIAEFKAQAPHVLRRLAETGEPILITQNGKPAAVLLAPAEFDRLQEREEFLESVASGLADAEAGRTISAAQLRRRLPRTRRSTPDR